MQAHKAKGEECLASNQLKLQSDLLSSIELTSKASGKASAQRNVEHVVGAQELAACKIYHIHLQGAWSGMKKASRKPFQLGTNYFQR